MDNSISNYLGFAGYVAACLMLGILTNFIKLKWSLILYFLMFWVGVVITVWPDITWKYGILEEIWLMAWQGTIYTLFPFFLVAGTTFLIGRFGYRLVVEMMNKSERK